MWETVFKGRGNDTWWQQEVAMSNGDYMICVYYREKQYFGV